MADTMLAGAAKVTITPPLPVQLAGYGCERLGIEVADDLHARALVVEHEGRRVALVACELLWLERRNLEVLRPMVGERCSIAADDLMVCCTHTHSGPDTIDWFHFAPVDQQWLHTLLKQIAGAVWLASQRLQPATFELHTGEVPIAVNRRVCTEREGFRLGHNPGGPVDQTLTTLRVRNEEGGLVASVVHHATHPVVLGGQSVVVSGDWCGEACRVVERTLGGVCLYVNGACGDINPRVGAGRTYAEVLRVGRQAGGAAVALLSSDQTDTPVGLASARTDLAVPHRTHPYLDIPQQRRLEADGAIRIEVQGLRIGPLTLISAPGECLVETGWAILERTRAKPARIAGYTNDYVGYLPLPHIYEQGGYEPSATMLTAEAVLSYVEAAVAVGDRLAG